MGNKQSKSKESECCWYWEVKPDPWVKFQIQTSKWAPYEIAVSEFIEENYKNNFYRFEIDKGEDTYIIDLEEERQYLKSDTNQQLPITRARRDEDINIYRENRFIHLITGLNADNNLTEYEEEKNLQQKLKVSQILGYKVDTTSNIYNLFNQEICVSSKICEELKKEFKENPPKTKLNTVKKVESFIADEISKQAERFYKIDNKVINTLDKLSSSYIKQAEIYNKKLKELKMSLAEKLIYIYTLEGFLVYSVNSILREGSVINCNLHLYFLLLQASIPIASTKYNPLISGKALHMIDGKEFYKLFRGAKISEKIILKDLENQNTKGSGRFLLFKDFLSTTREQKQGQSFLKCGDLTGDLVKVFYNILIPKKEADTNPLLMCFIEEISAHNEFEVLVSSSTIFQIQIIEKKQIQDTKNNIAKNIYFYDVTLMYISNGFNKFDFIKYSTLKEINLSNNQIGDDVSKAIGDSLRVNTALTNINLGNNQIGDVGAKAIGDALRVNAALTRINLSYNKIGAVGGKTIGDALRVNTALTEINLSYNKFGAVGGKTIGDALRVNTALTEINLSGNQIGDVGANAIGDALRVNTDLTRICLSNIQIGDDGAKAIGNALGVNTALKEIILDNNQIGADGGNAIGEALGLNTALKEINLWNNQIGDVGGKAIGDAIKANTALSKIYLDYNQIGDVGGKAIGDALRVNTALTVIGLGNNQIGDNGAKAFVRALQVNPALTYVNLENNQITWEIEENLRRFIQVTI